ncbi:hypothetical protein V1525DRAFT_322248, partial [Lipomyces kononenkoae]
RLKKDQQDNMAFLPLSIEPAQLVPEEFDLKAWEEQAFGALDDFFDLCVVRRVVRRVTLPEIQTTTALSFEHFAVFDCAWSRACWDLLREDFRARMEEEGYGRYKITYLGIWLLIPWVLGTIIYRLYRIAPGSPEFARLEEGSARGELARAPFKFQRDTYGDHRDFLAGVREAPPPLP